ncbi:MAG: hypothetical protein KBS74_08440 [Clostridiales bacterium]|nr:hypothetical protein [Candidatus Cacconaster stercorequi]
MCYVAAVGIYFAPVIFMLLFMWALVRAENLDDAEEAQKSAKRKKIWLICAVASIAVFGVLKLIFPIPV